MVICKFFLQGCCRFGDHCKFEHQINDSYSTNKQHNSLLWQPQLSNTQFQNQNNSFQKQNNSIFGSQENQTSPGIVDVDTLVKSVVNDMTALEHSGQWLLSCYGPFKEKAVFPGFEDYCFEEMRNGFYEAVKNGTVEQYKQHINGVLQQAVLRVKSLEKPSPEVIEILKNIYYGQGSQTTTSSASVFGSAPPTFNQNNFPAQNTSVFPQANQNLFGKSSVQSQPFASTTGNLFAMQNIDSKQVPSQNIFAQANVNLSSVNSGSIFGSQQTSTTTSNSFQTPLFGQPSSPSSVFSHQNNIFQQPTIATTPNMFGNQPVQKVLPLPQQKVSPQPQQKVLPQPQQRVLSTANTFGGNSSLTSSLSQQASMFNPTSFVTSTPQQQPQQSSIFGNQPTNSPLFQANNTDSGNQGSNIFITHTNAPPYDESLYSRREELTTEEMRWFESDEIDPMTIPEKPPTFDMCFKP